jgi:hypothetical protein
VLELPYIASLSYFAAFLLCLSCIACPVLQTLQPLTALLPSCLSCAVLCCSGDDHGSGGVVQQA